MTKSEKTPLRKSTDKPARPAITRRLSEDNQDGWLTRSIGLLDIGTWAQIILAVLLIIIPILTGSLLETFWIRFNIDKFSWILYAVALGLVYVSLRSKQIPERIVSLSLAVLVATYGIYLQAYQPWCDTAGIKFSVAETNLPSNQFTVTQNHEVKEVQPDLLLTITAAPDETLDHNFFTGWGSECEWNEISRARTDKQHIIQSKDCTVKYSMGHNESPEELFVTINRPSCHTGGQLSQDLRLFLKATE